MTDAQQPPPSPPSSNPPSSPGGTPVTVEGLIQAFVAVLTRPAVFFESIRSQSGLVLPVAFAAAMGLTAGVIYALYAIFGLGAMTGGAVGLATAFGMILFMPLVAVVAGSFVGGAIVHVISLVAGGKGSFEQSVRVASYSLAVIPISALIGFLPLVRHLPSFYGLYLIAIGVMALHLADRKKTWVVTGVLAGILVLLIIVGTLAGAAV